MRARDVHTRIRPDRVVAIEIWDLEVRGQTLFAAREAPDFAGRLAEGVEAIRRGEAGGLALLDAIGARRTNDNST